MSRSRSADEAIDARLADGSLFTTPRETLEEEAQRASRRSDGRALSLAVRAGGGDRRLERDGLGDARRGRGARRSSSAASARGSRSRCRGSATSRRSSSPAATACSGTTSTRPPTRSFAFSARARTPRCTRHAPWSRASSTRDTRSSFAVGRIGRGSKFPPQLGQTPPSRLSTQSAQNVHSKVQIRASALSGGRSRSQHSQFGRSSSTQVNLS